MPARPELITTSATHREPAPLPAQEESTQRKAFERAAEKAAESARRVAASLGVRLLGLHDRRETLSLDDGVLLVRVELVYRVSPFSQLRSDLLTLPTINNIGGLVKQELSTRWFSYRYQVDRGPQVSQRPSARRALVAGHFSIPGGGGTFGDIEVMEMVCGWLAAAGIEFDVASNLKDGVPGTPLGRVDSARYTHFIFACGPWRPLEKIPALLLERFGHCLKIGVNLTTFEEGSAGFDVLLARDNPSGMRADLAFGRELEPLPVLGVLLINRQKTYGSRQRHRFVRQVVEEYLGAGEAAPLWLDTVANLNSMGIGTPRQFESILRKTDLVVTNRLHGLVLTLKNSIPVIAIDAVAGGGKVTAQARALGWPVLIPAEELSVAELRECIASCLGGRRAAQIRSSQHQGLASIEETKKEFLEVLQK